MNRFVTIVIPIALVMWVGTTMLFIKTSMDAYGEFEEEKLDLVVNYAVDAAVDEMVEMTPDLGLDYADYEYAQVKPDVALDMFTTIFLKGYGMPESSASLVKTKYLPMFCVAAYDGYYIAQPMAVGENSSGVEFDSVFTMKQPYLYENGNKLYALNLGLGDCRTLAKGSGGDYSIVGYGPSGLSKEKQLQIINSDISDAMMKTVWEQKAGNMLHTIYVPSKLTSVAATNPVQNVTVFAYASDIPLGWGKSLETFGIGGTKITHERYVVCYEKDGKKWYTYSDAKNVSRDSSGLSYTVSVGGTEITVLEVLDSATRAAEKGYYFDYDYFEEK